MWDLGIHWLSRVAYFWSNHGTSKHFDVCQAHLLRRAAAHDHAAQRSNQHTKPCKMYESHNSIQEYFKTMRCCTFTSSIIHDCLYDSALYKTGVRRSGLHEIWKWSFYTKHQGKNQSWRCDIGSMVLLNPETNAKIIIPGRWLNNSTAQEQTKQTNNPITFKEIGKILFQRNWV